MIFARLVQGDSIVSTIGLSFAALVEVFVVAGSIRYRVRDVRDPFAIGVLAKTAMASTLVGCAAATLLALAFFERVSRSALNALEWYTAHVLGMVIAATLTLLVVTRRRHLLGVTGKRWRLLLGLGFVGSVTTAVFLQNRYSVLFAVLAAQLWLTFREGWRGVVLGALLLSIIAGVLTTEGFGPLYVSALSEPERVFLFQFFVGIVCLVTWPVALGRTQRLRAERAQAESRRLLQGIADNVPAIIAYFNQDAVYVFANAGVGELLGKDPKALIGHTLREAAGDEVYKAIESHVKAVLRGERRTYERTANLRGVERYFEVTFIPDVSPDGSVRGFFALSYDVSERKKTERILDQLARRDSLTGLANRREFDERVERAFSSRADKIEPLVLMLIDIDNFKEINDTYGHLAGDAVLAAVARRLQSCVFDVDLVARFGGDEFAIFMDHARSADDAETVADRIISAMKRPITVGDHSIKATLSIGLAVARSTVTIEQLKAEADRALYAVKAGGRNAHRKVDLATSVQ